MPNNGWWSRWGQKRDGGDEACFGVSPSHKSTFSPAHILRDLSALRTHHYVMAEEEEEVGQRENGRLLPGKS